MLNCRDIKPIVIIGRATKVFHDNAISVYDATKGLATVPIGRMAPVRFWFSAIIPTMFKLLLPSKRCSWWK